MLPHVFHSPNLHLLPLPSFPHPPPPQSHAKRFSIQAQKPTSITSFSYPLARILYAVTRVTLRICAASPISSEISKTRKKKTAQGSKHESPGRFFCGGNFFIAMLFLLVRLRTDIRKYESEFVQRQNIQFPTHGNSIPQLREQSPQDDRPAYKIRCIT